MIIDFIRTNEQEISEETLKGADVLVISGAFVPLTSSEIDTIVHFVERGGKLCVMLHIGQPVAELLWKFNVLVSNGVILEDENLINDKQKIFILHDLNLILSWIRKVCYSWGLGSSRD